MSIASNNPLATLLNRLSDPKRAEVLHNCCGSTAWVSAMHAAAPYGDDQRVITEAESAWRRLSPEDREQAFAAHPRIGDIESLRAKYKATKDWAAGEQAGVSNADEDTLHALAEQNAAYEHRFKRLFIICATGKSAAEMLAALNRRLTNNAVDEYEIASAEQLKITLLRLRKLTG